MTAMGYERPPRLVDAIELAAKPGHVVLGGGTTLMDLMRLGVHNPRVLVDVTKVPELTSMECVAHEWLVGASVTMSQAARCQKLRAEHPAFVESLELAASAQIRNTATLAGNLLQSPRCVFFRDVRAACARRDGGTRCMATEVDTAPRALFAGPGPCVAAYPGDLGVALVALSAEVDIVTRVSEQRTSVEALLSSETANMNIGGLMTRIVVPRKGGVSAFVKRRARTSFAFGSASAAVWCDFDGDVVREVRVVVGAQSTIPRRLAETETALTGRRLDDQTIRVAAQAGVSGVRGTDVQRRWCVSTLVQALTVAEVRRAAR